MKPTLPDIEGPFYKEGAPFLPLTNNPNLNLFGMVYNTDGEPIPALLDFWQADENGKYDNDGYKFRGKVFADLLGYKVQTIRPGSYQIDEHEYRCSHIHVKVTAIGFKTLVTQLYFKDDKYNDSDEWFDSSRIISDDGQFNFVLEEA